MSVSAAVHEAPRGGVRPRGAALALLPVFFLGTWATWAWAWERWTLPYYSQLGVWPLCGGLLAWAWVWAGQGAGAAQGVARSWLAAAAVLLVAFAAMHGRVPGTMTAQVSVMALGCVLLALLGEVARRGSWGLVPWLMMSVELGPTPEYYLGYPLRVAVAWMSSIALGRGIERSGASLTDGVHTVLVDAPCSGLRMMTMGLLLGAAASVVLRLTPGRTFVMLAAAGVVTVLGNVQRAIILFHLEPLPRWAHEGVGVAMFIGCVVILLLLAAWLKDRQRRLESGELLLLNAASRRVVVGFLLACVAAAVAPLFTQRVAVATPVNVAFAAWPESIGGERLVPVALDPGMEAFFAQFAGKAAQFTLERSGYHVLLRQAFGTTQVMHPSENCYMVQGWRTSPMPAVRDAEGRLWGRFRAEAPGGTVRVVRQCIFSVAPGARGPALEDLVAGAPSWPDTSAWYWSVARPGAAAPLSLCVTIAEPGV